MQIYKQKREYDCMLACIATAIQKPYEELWPEEFLQLAEEKKGVYGETVDKAFELASLRKDTDYWCVYIPQEWATSGNLRKLLNGRRALLQVPSLNNFEAWHLVYWTGEVLYDPSNKQRYQWLSQCVPQYIWVFNEIIPQ